MGGLGVRWMARRILDSDKVLREPPAYHAAGLRMAEVDGVEHGIILGYMGIMQKKTETIGTIGIM